MYDLNSDFFDHFKVTFAGGETIINGAYHPLGSFATEALELDLSIVVELERQLPVLMEALKIFFAARDSSSAAEAQQILNSLWSALLRLPVYKLFVGEAMSHQNLMRYLRTHPEETDDMMTPGTERNKAYLYWLERLKQLPDRLRGFIRDTHFMLSEYFDDLTVRRPAAYAQAFARYQQAARDDFRMAAERESETGSIEPIPHIAIEFSTMLSFSGIRQKDGFVLGESMIFEGLVSFLYAELYKGMAVGHIPRRCHNCGKYFLLTSAYNICYCTGIAPGEAHRTCRQVGAHRKEQQKIGSDFIRREYSRAYTRLKQRKNRGTITVDAWNQQMAVAQELRERALRGELGETELRRGLGTL